MKVTAPSSSQKNQSPKFKKTKIPIPKIIKPVPSKGSRRMVDSALSSRPTTPRTNIEPNIEIENLPITDINSLVKIEQELTVDPATSRSTSLLKHLSGLQSSNPDKSLDEIFIIVKQWNPDSILNIDFRVYHLITQALFSIIKQFYKSNSISPTYFKSLAISLHLIPISDRDSLLVVIQCLYHLSKEESFDHLFLEYSILPQLISHAFSEIDPICTISASILRHISTTQEIALELIKTGISRKLGLALRTNIRRNRFTPKNSLYYYQLIGLLSNIIPFLIDLSAISNLDLPLSILELSNIYETDSHIQSMCAHAISLMMADKLCVESLETEEIAPFFPLIQSGRLKTRAASASALANAMQQSQFITKSICDFPAPLGVYTICVALQNTLPQKTGDSVQFNPEDVPNDVKDLMLSLLRCLAKATEFPDGAKQAIIYLDVFIPFLDFPLSDVETWTIEQMIVANTLVTLKNFAMFDPRRVAMAVSGKLQQLMYFGVVDYVVDMMRNLMKCEEGQKVCDEVRNVEEVAFLLSVQPQQSLR